MLRKIIFILFLVFLSKNSSSQFSLFSDTLKIEDSTILIATSNQFKQFEFCITNKGDIKKALKKIKYDQEKETSYEKNPIVIKLVNKGLLTKTWIVKPIANAIEIDGKKYSFDTAILLDLKKKFPIEYFIEEKYFGSQKQQDDFYLKLLKDKKFLYYIPRDFEKQYLEKFFLTFKKNNRFPSPLAISNYLDTLLLNQMPKEKYSISYSPFGDAKKDSADELTMTIYSVYELFGKFNDTNCKKSGLTHFPTYIVRKK